MGSELTEAAEPATSASTNTSAPEPGTRGRDAGRAGPDPPSEVSEQYKLSFEAECTARYHTFRRGFFERAHKISLFCVVAVGTTGVSTLVVRSGFDAAWLAGVAALFGALNLVFDPAGAARRHEALQRRAQELCGAIDRTLDPTAKHFAQWKESLHGVYGDEPPPLRALHALAYNATLSGRKERPNDDLLVVTGWHRAMAQFLPFTNERFPRRSEIATRK
jgi:hypothetical protein